MMKRRLWAILLCLTMLLSLPGAFAREEEPFVPYTVSHSVRTEEGVTLSGTRAMVDYTLLRQLNRDTVGWLYQESTGFSQPVLQSYDNQHYLTYAFDDTRLVNHGSVALEARSSFSAGTVALYGLGRTEGVFSLLNEYTAQSWSEDHPTLRLLSPELDWQADVFACIRTTHSDEDSWRAPENEPGFAQWLAWVEESNLLTPTEGRLPEYGDQVLALIINNKTPKRNVVLCTLRPITYETSENCNLVKAELDSRPSTSGMRDVGTLGQYMVYGQNDPIWDRMRYESAKNSTFRVFGGGGCGPTAAAIALANLVDMNELPKLALVSKNGSGTLMCPCSVNRVYCSHTHVPYLVQTPEEYLRYLPVVMGDFAAGNNIWGVVSRQVGSYGSSMQFLDLICDVFGIYRTNVTDLTDGLEKLKGRAGECVMVCTALVNSPFTNTSHYVVVAGVDEEYFYVLDPLFRDSYFSTDKREILEVLDTGVTRIRLNDSGYSDLTPLYIMEKSGE